MFENSASKARRWRVENIGIDWEYVRSRKTLSYQVTGEHSSLFSPPLERAIATRCNSTSDRIAKAKGRRVATKGGAGLKRYDFFFDLLFRGFASTRGHVAAKESQSKSIMRSTLVFGRSPTKTFRSLDPRCPFLWRPIETLKRTINDNAI